MIFDAVAGFLGDAQATACAQLTLVILAGIIWISLIWIKWDPLLYLATLSHGVGGDFLITLILVN